MKTFKKISHEPTEQIHLKEGESVIGVIDSLKTTTSKFGNMEVLILNCENVKKSLIITSGLSIYNFRDMIGLEVKIEYKGEKKNPKSGRYFKSYDLYISEDEIPF